jgi:apolipoprotein N-acyltransferase
MVITNKGGNIMQCEKCESKKTQTWGKGIFFFGFLYTTSILFWVALLIPIFWVVVIVMLALMVASPFLPKVVYCKDCNHVFKCPKSVA